MNDIYGISPSTCGRRRKAVLKDLKTMFGKLSMVSMIFMVLIRVHVRTWYIVITLVIYWKYGRWRKRVLKGLKTMFEKLVMKNCISMFAYLVPAHVYACIAPSRPLVLRVLPTKDSYNSTLCSYSSLCLLLAECSTSRVVLMALAFARTSVHRACKPPARP
jgi:hypothetical protein